MSSFNVSRSSWHYKFINVFQRSQLYAFTREAEHPNTCGYVSMFMWSLFWAALASLGVAVLAFIVLIVPVATILQAAGLLYLGLTPDQIGVGFTVILVEAIIAATLIYMIFFHDRLVKAFKDRKKPDAEPTPLGKIVHSYHSKVCVPVKIID